MHKNSSNESTMCKLILSAPGTGTTHTHTHLTALFPGLPRWAGTRKVEPIWILLQQETVSGSGISWARCKSAPHSRQITMPAPHSSVFFTGRMPFLPPNQQHQSTEGMDKEQLLWHYSQTSFVQSSNLMAYPTSSPRLTPISSDTRLATDMAATRRGWVQPIMP